MAIKSTLPERYPDIIAMYAKGHANSKDILKADFVQWPPKGLDIVDTPDIDMKFKSIYGTLPGLLRFLPSMTSLYLMTAFFKSYPLTTIALTTLSTVSKVMSLGGFVRRGEPTIHLNDGYRLFGRTLAGRRFTSHVLSHEFQHIVQGRDAAESLSSAFEGDRLNIRDMLTKDASKSQKYQAEECEIQARMHTVMVGAYHQFELMPTSYEELIAVLYSQGVKLPNVVVRDVKDTPEGKVALELFKPNKDLLNRYGDKSAARDLSRMIKSINPWKRKVFSEEVLPFIYGDYLELLGDQKGHKRMGHGHNIQLREIFYRSAKDYKIQKKALAELENKNTKEVFSSEDSLPVDDLIKQAEEEREIERKMNKHFNRALDVVGKMDKQDAVHLSCNILRSDFYFEHGSLECVTVEKGGIGEAAVKLIWANQDLTQGDRYAMHTASRSLNSHYGDTTVQGMERRNRLSHSNTHPHDDNPRNDGSGGGARKFDLAA